MTILTQLHEAVNSDGLTVSEAIDKIIPGADVAYWQRRLANYNPGEKTKKRKPRRRSGGKNRRTFRASQVLSGAELQTYDRHTATSELIARVNDTPTDGPQPDPQGGWQVILNGEPVCWPDDEESARRIYHDIGLPDEPIIWNVNGQTRLLEVI